MTTFEDVELSPDRGEPFELYLFLYGPGGAEGSQETGYYAYTTATMPISANIPDYDQPVIFTPMPVQREAFKSSGKTDVGNMTLRLPITARLANLFLDFPPTQEIAVIIRVGHYAQTEQPYPVIWMGRVLSSARERNVSVLTCSSTLVSMKRVGLRRNYQYACPYVLYSQQCTASKAAASYTTTVLEVHRNTIVLSPGWYGAMDPVKFEGGMLKWTSELGDEYRAINRVTSEGISFVGPVRGMVAGQQVVMILGCNHKTDDCTNLHNNILNYGGQPWIPLKNPVKQHSFW